MANALMIAGTAITVQGQLAAGRAAKKAGVDLNGKDYDHTKKKFTSVKANRGGHGKGTKK